MNYYKIYKKVIKDIDKIEGNEGKNLDTLLKTFKEFDYKKNFGYEEK